jgi:hypothetical protein
MNEWVIITCKRSPGAAEEVKRIAESRFGLEEASAGSFLPTVTGKLPSEHVAELAKLDLVDHVERDHESEAL